MTLSYIKAFNRSAQQAIDIGLSKELVDAIKLHKSKFDKRDYYETLDSLGFSIGIEFIVQYTFDVDLEKIISWTPSLKYHPKNPVTQEYQLKELSEFKTINKAYAYMAKKHLYALMEVNDIARKLKLDVDN